jgi:Holliday junction resolvase RusA-like endonuclease
MRVSFAVFGTPQPQGSTRAFTPKGHTRPIITSDNARLKPWRQELAWVAVDAMNKTHQQKAPRGVPISVSLAFYFEKPKSARKSALWKTSRPDLDKLLRAVLDALTGIAYEDDSQVCFCTIEKAFSSPTRVEILVRTIEGVPKTPARRSPQHTDSALGAGQLSAFQNE